MNQYKVIILPQAEKELKFHIKSGNKPTCKKIHQMLIELKTHPYKGIGNPEQLKYQLSGLWSRRINSKDRLIYMVEDNIVTVTVASAKGHYSNK